MSSKRQKTTSAAPAASGGGSKRQKVGGASSSAGAPPTFTFTFTYDYEEEEEEEEEEDEDDDKEPGKPEHAEPKPTDEYDHDEYPGVHTCTASVSADGQDLGTVRLLFCQRNTDDFFTNCDAVSQDLQETSCLLYQSDGEPRHPLVCAHADDDFGEVFLYVDDLDLESPQQELPPLALKALLRALREIRPWALVAFYSSAPRSRAAPYSRDDSPAAEAACRGLADENRLLVVRAGFVQVDDGPVYIAAPAHSEGPPLSRAAALAVPEREEPEFKDMSAPNAELFELLRSALELPAPAIDGACVAGVKKLLKRGATLAGALALHVCAASGSVEGLAALLRLVPKEQGAAAASVADHLGNTPLHLAAEHSLGAVSGHAPLPSLGLCSALIAAGASVSAVNLKGVTPYGHFEGCGAFTDRTCLPATAPPRA